MDRLNDVNGKRSSKRIIAVAAMGAAIVLAVLGVVLDSEVAAQLVWPFIALAGGEGFASVLERRV